MIGSGKEWSRNGRAKQNLAREESALIWQGMAWRGIESAWHGLDKQGLRCEKKRNRKAGLRIAEDRAGNSRGKAQKAQHSKGYDGNSVAEEKLRVAKEKKATQRNTRQRRKYQNERRKIMSETEITSEGQKQSTELIEVTQLPVIVERLYAVREQFKAAAEESYALEVSEDTLQAAKKQRAAMTKVFNDLEERRKTVKKQILAPYEEFEKIYRECVTEIYKPCDEALAGKISEIENGLKKKKQDELEAYFKELCAAKGIDFLKLSDCGISVNLSTSLKKLRETVASFVEKVEDELNLIKTQTFPEEILVEYKQSLNLARAITAVNDRHFAIEQEQKQLEAARKQREEALAAETRVEEAVEEYAPPVIETEPDIPAPEDPSGEKLYKVSFTVTASLDKIKALKEFLVKGNYDYE